MMLVDANGVILAASPRARAGAASWSTSPSVGCWPSASAACTTAWARRRPTLFLVEPLLRETSRAWDAAVVIALPRQAVFRAADRLFMLQLAGLGVLALGGSS